MLSPTGHNLQGQQNIQKQTQKKQRWQRVPETDVPGGKKVAVVGAEGSGSR